MLFASFDLIKAYNPTIWNLVKFSHSPKLVTLKKIFFLWGVSSSLTPKTIYLDLGSTLTNFLLGSES